jgi:serine/threonine protein kinase
MAMSEIERFGNYLLLKRLEETGLGESFRAARVGSQGLEQVVLLQVFNAEGVGRDTLTHMAATRSELRSLLGGPGTGKEVDMGAVAGTPYVAYDYASGRSLATVLKETRVQQFPMPTDHALLVAERIAQGLAAAEELRLEDRPVMHGFVVPPLIYLSAEGDVRVLGFEVAPGLRQFASSGPLRQAFGAYLPPEALSGEPLNVSESAWSLGAILFELLTGAPPVHDEPVDEQLAKAHLLSDRAPLPGEMAELLRRSLGTKDERIADATSWHREITRLMSDGEYSPTTFNLAFFMHSLLRDQIEKESEGRKPRALGDGPGHRHRDARCRSPRGRGGRGQSGGVTGAHRDERMDETLRGRYDAGPVAGARRCRRRARFGWRRLLLLPARTAG